MKKQPVLSRRALLGAAVGIAAVGGVERLLGTQSRSHISGSILGPSFKHGHLLRETREWQPTSTRRVPLLIIGGGISGLSAAWALKRHGFEHFELLELEAKPGGNSQNGENDISQYPWGAHYVPVPGKDAVLVRKLFEEFDIISGYQDGKPIYREEYLCSAPHERLHQFGVWVDGLYPQLGIMDSDRQEYLRWHDLMDSLSTAVGEDGRPAFTIPMELSSTDSQFRSLDAMSFAAYVQQQGFSSRPLHWYLNYCCLDDYGAPMEEVSAWAGVHYFASRTAWAANVEDYDLLTWPAGNGWIVQRLVERLSPYIRCNRLVVHIDDRAAEPKVLVLNTQSQEIEEITAPAVLYCGPRFTAARVVASLQERRPEYLQSFHYHPWMVANVTLTGTPNNSPKGLAWDNVFYQSSSLGYVNATHQVLGRRGPATVLTYYLPLADKDPVAARKAALERTWPEWRDLILADLKTAHPDIIALTRSIDVWIWGHGMICPSPGFVWGVDRDSAKQFSKPLYFAHSDMSGISIFEEAQYRGVVAAEQYLKDFGLSFKSLMI